MFIVDIPHISFSSEPGFYDEAFDLQIMGSGDIYYTLDGTEPDTNSIRYDGTIHLDDASLNPNIYSMRTDTSTGFDEQLIKDRNAGDFRHYHQPGFLVDKCTVIRAVSYNERGVKSNEIRGSFFVDFDDKAGYEGINVISIYTDESNLFDYKKGIYVTGETFDRFLNGEIETEYNDWWWWPANYRNKGIEWERPATAEFYSKDGQLILRKDIGIRTQGAGTRGMLPRSLNLYAREEYDNTESFEAGLFDDPTIKPDSINLFAGGNSYFNRATDYLVHKNVSGRNIATSEFKPYALFLNGEYWGFYWLTERFDENYFATHYGVDADNVVIVKNMLLEAGIDSDFEEYNRIMSYLRNSDVTREDVYRGLDEYVDFDSLLDYYALMIYISRHDDWPGNNVAIWRVRHPKNGEYSDGRWRWILFDVNGGALEKSQIQQNTIENTRENDMVFDNLMNSKIFRQELSERILDISDNDLEAKKMVEQINDYREAYRDSVQNDLKRFYNGNQDIVDRYDESLNDLEAFFTERPLYVKELLEEILYDN